MSAYYNEHDEFAAGWLRNLIKAGLIADGEVDTRSIVDVRADDLRGFTQCHFFAGIGGWSYALRKAGWNDNRPAWTGSCPCQPFSLAGAQRGFADERHLWPVWRDLVEIVRPSVVFGEQVASATDWLGLVRSDLEKMGYAVGALPIQAASAGADHLRDRYWFVAHTDDAGLQGRGILPERAGQRPAGSDGLADADQLGAREGWEQRSGQLGGAGCHPQACDGSDMADALRGRAGDAPEHSNSAQGAPVGINGDASWTSAPAGVDGANCDMADSQGERQRRGEGAAGSGGWSSAQDCRFEWVIGADGKARRVKPGIRLLAHGVSGRVGKLRGFGNAIDPRPAAAFIGAYIEAVGTPAPIPQDGQQ